MPDAAVFWGPAQARCLFQPEKGVRNVCTGVGLELEIGRHLYAQHFGRNVLVEGKRVEEAVAIARHRDVGKVGYLQRGRPERATRRFVSYPLLIFTFCLASAASDWR